MSSHKKIYEGLKMGFNDNQSGIMSEALIELAEQ
jgi:hypothetical protein